MGYEYRIKADSSIQNLEDICAQVFSKTQWRRIPTLLENIANGIGVQQVMELDDPSWPHVADLYLENHKQIFMLCHNHSSWQFMHAFIEVLKSNGYVVVVDEDV